MNGKLTATLSARGRLKGMLSRNEKITINPIIEPLTVIENGEYKAPENIHGYNPVNVNVPSRYNEGYTEGYNKGNTDGYQQGNLDGYNSGYENGYQASQDSITLQEKTTTKNGIVTADDGYTGLGKVNVEVPERYDEGYSDGYDTGFDNGVASVKLQTKNITENGEYTPDDNYSGFSKVNVNVPNQLEDLNEVLTEQEELIEELQEVLKGKASGGGGNSDLPNGYTRVDYIQFTGKESIDTGIICNQNTKIQTYFTRESSSKLYLYGVANSDNSASVTAYLGGTWRFGKKYASKTTSMISEDIGYGVCVDATQIGLTSSVTALSDVADFETIGTLLIGTCRASSGAIGNPQFVGKIFFFTIWQDEELALKLVPVVSAEGHYRFFDMISKAFFDSITDTALEGGNL